MENNKQNNVVCCRCGKKGFNPLINENHVVDNCGDLQCLLEAEGRVIGFLDGDIQNYRLDNLYYVNNSDVVNHKQFLDCEVENEINYDLVNVYRLIEDQEYLMASKAMKSKNISNLPLTAFYTSKVFFRKQKNTALGMKWLKKASDGGVPSAMGEYGYIITKGLYGSVKRPEEGITLLLKAYKLNDLNSTSYLADIYRIGFNGIDAFDLVSDSEWFNIALIASDVIKDNSGRQVLGVFYANGTVTERNLERAYKYLKLAAQEGYVMACYHLAHLIYYNRQDPMFVDKVEEAKHFTECFLATAENGDELTYTKMQIMLVQLQSYLGC